MPERRSIGLNSEARHQAKKVSGKMYDEYGALLVSSGKSKIRFGRVEIRHMIIAVLALTLAFTVVYLQGYGLWGSLPAVVELLAVSGVTGIFKKGG